jgi:hypothetical protein
VFIIKELRRHIYSGGGLNRPYRARGRLGSSLKKTQGPVFLPLRSSFGQHDKTTKKALEFLKYT